MLRRIDSGPALVGLAGTLLWAMISGLAGMHRAPLGIIELLFLFAVLAVVPLGLELARPTNREVGTALLRAACVLQPLAAFCVVCAFWRPPGRVAAAFCVPWLTFALIAAASGIAPWLRKNSRSSASLIVSVAQFDLAFGSGWLVLSRAGIRPMGFVEPIVLLTAVHFHFSGFATALIAASAIRLFDRHGVGATYLRRVVWLVVFLPFGLALGIAVSPLLRLISALALSAAVTGLAALLFWFSPNLQTGTARIFVRMASCAAFVALGLACAYALADYTGKPFLAMPAMATTHGVLNSVGFVLLTMLACLIELRARELEGRSGSRPAAVADAGSAVPRRRPAGVPPPVPEFVAKDFYDR
jgi:hypothetical protein